MTWNLYDTYSHALMNGAALKKIRRQLGLTQKELADKIGVSSNTVARWERNELRITEPIKRLVTLIASQR
ncbi:MAG: hypothetical protein NTAFB01_21150 [Nitrospira sp.]